MEQSNSQYLFMTDERRVPALHAAAGLLPWADRGSGEVLERLREGAECTAPAAKLAACAGAARNAVERWR